MVVASGALAAVVVGTFVVVASGEIGGAVEDGTVVVGSSPTEVPLAVVVASSSISCAGVVVIDCVTLLGNPVVTAGAIADEVVVVDDDSLTDEPVVETLCSSTLLSLLVLATETLGLPEPFKNPLSPPYIFNSSNKLPTKTSVSGTQRLILPWFPIPVVLPIVRCQLELMLADDVMWSAELSVIDSNSISHTTTTTDNKYILI